MKGAQLVFGMALYAGICVVAAAAVQNDAMAVADDPVQLVNTFIGSKDDGNTFPGASAPFGMIQVSPIGEHYAGWRYDDPKIRGFGHFFLSGAGCWEQGGQVSVLPINGKIGPGAGIDTNQASSFDQTAYAASYDHQGEVGQAGYYKVRLGASSGDGDTRIVAETTALTRSAAERYSFPAGAQAQILVNLGQATERHRVMHSAVHILDDHTLEGEVQTLSFCGGTTYTTWFRLEFDQPFSAFGTWNKQGGTPASRDSVSAEEANGAWLSFDLKSNRAVTLVSAVSHVDAQGARNNLLAEARIGGKLIDFDTMKHSAQDAWRNELGSVRVKGGDQDDRVVFFTSLYHVLLQPLTGNDADGRYRGWDNQIHHAEGWTYYEFFSLWDTYRAQNQMLALLRPQRARDIGRSVVTIAQQGGWLPRWGYANYETNVMSGDPVTPFLADLWRYGLLQGIESEAYAALKQNADGMPPAASRQAGRSGNDVYLAKGFVQYDKAFKPKSMDADPVYGASATLEYAQGDCSLALVAQGLGRSADAQRYRVRGANWRNLWDASVVDRERGFKGFPRPKNQDGSWYSPKGKAYAPSSEDGFHEGTAWQYQWLEQQDVPALMAAMGGAEQAHKRLDAFFAYDKLATDPLHAARKEWVMGAYDYYNQFRYNPNNEPDLHSPWMYTLMGQPWKTATVLRAAQTLFTNAPDGVTGNDDLGTMSAWYLFSAIGIYPGMPGTGTFLLHPPRFTQVEIDLENHRKLTIDAPGADARRLQYVDSVNVDGKPHAAVWTDWEHLHAGGEIRYQLTDQAPTTGWGTQPADLPPAACASKR